MYFGTIYVTGIESCDKLESIFKSILQSGCCFSHGFCKLARLNLCRNLEAHAETYGIDLERTSWSMTCPHNQT